MVLYNKNTKLVANIYKVLSISQSDFPRKVKYCKADVMKVFEILSEISSLIEILHIIFENYTFNFTLSCFWVDSAKRGAQRSWIGVCFFNYIK